MQKKIEKNLGGMMDSEVVDLFTSQVNERGHKNKRALEAAVRLWISLPEEIQARLLNKTLSENSFIELVNQIVDERIAAGHEAGSELVRRRKKKKGLKG